MKRQGVILLRLTPKERSLVKRIADRAGMPLAVFARVALLERARAFAASKT